MRLPPNPSKRLSSPLTPDSRSWPRRAAGPEPVEGLTSVTFSHPPPPSGFEKRSNALTKSNLRPVTPLGGRSSPFCVQISHNSLFYKWLVHFHLMSPLTRLVSPPDRAAACRRGPSHWDGSESTDRARATTPFAQKKHGLYKGTKRQLCARNRVATSGRNRRKSRSGNA